MTLKQGKSGGNWGKFKRSFVFRLPIFRKRRSPVRIDSGEYCGLLYDEKSYNAAFGDLMMPSPAIWDNEQLPSSSGRAIRELQNMKRWEMSGDYGFPEVGSDRMLNLQREYNIMNSMRIDQLFPTKDVIVEQQFTDTLTMPVWKFILRRFLNG